MFGNWAHQVFAQGNDIIYLIHGQGSDQRIFKKLQLDSYLRVRYIQYPYIEKGESIYTYAQKITEQIDTSQGVVLIGVSLGGMICMELNKIVKVKQTILISSAKKREELPFQYRLQKFIPIYKIVPASLIKKGALWIQPKVEKAVKNDLLFFQSMLAAKSSIYYKRSIQMITQWDNDSVPKNCFHLHGTRDNTLPIKNIKSDYVIEGGSHMMVYFKAKEVSSIINDLVKDCRP